MNPKVINGTKGMPSRIERRCKAMSNIEQPVALITAITNVM
ncbi:hypothetical protein [Erysipelothrix aquatica]|nr:hypothetical protein [Erysipelothrix aquatica]